MKIAGPERNHDDGGDYEVTQNEFRRSERRYAPALRHGGIAQYRSNAAAQPADVEQAQRASERHSQGHSPSSQKAPGYHRDADHDIGVALKPPLDPTVVYLAHLRNRDFKLAGLNLSNHE